MEEGEEEETGVAAAGIKPDPVCIVYKVSLYLSPGGIGSFYTGNHHALFGRSTSPPVIIMATRRDFMVLPRLVTLNIPQLATNLWKWLIETATISKPLVTRTARMSIPPIALHTQQDHTHFA